MSDKKISPAVIHRLPRYYRYLSELSDEGVERISSGELSERMHVTASQIRQDLNNFGGFGQQGYGYQVASLKDEIGRILGIDRGHRVIIVGAGNLGRALANYPGFEKRGYVITGIFDSDKEKCGTSAGTLTIRHTDELASFLKNTPADIAALTLPKVAAPEVAESLSRLGVKGFWNFTSAELMRSEQLQEAGAVIENVHLAESLMRLSYALNS
ncbi:MAG: redox-sensing transcriptional repressor Rex [Eubacterium sp.]|nr:redox-sensing transcriptional repressor Rex [Eubacterium sp.]